MSVHPLPNAAPVKVPDANTIAVMQERIHSRADFIQAREDGVWQATIFLQSIEDHGPALTFEQAGAMLTVMALDEIARLPKPNDSILSDAALLAVARFTGFFDAMGGYLFNAWKDRQS
jgi:hypothetical protein